MVIGYLAQTGNSQFDYDGKSSLIIFSCPLKNTYIPPVQLLIIHANILKLFDILIYNALGIVTFPCGGARKRKIKIQKLNKHMTCSPAQAQILYRSERK